MTYHAQLRRAASAIQGDAVETYSIAVTILERARRELVAAGADACLDGVDEAMGQARYEVDSAPMTAEADAYDQLGDWERDQREFG